MTGRSRVTQHNAQSEEACVEHLPQGLVALRKNVYSSPIGQSDVHSSLLPASSRATKRKGGWSPVPTGTAQKTCSFKRQIVTVLFMYESGFSSVGETIRVLYANTKSKLA